MVDFPGFGRIIERGDADESEEAPPAPNLKQLDSPTARSTLSTGRDLSGRCLSDETRAPPEQVTANDAQLICQSVLAELLTGAAPVDHEASAAAADVVSTPREEEVETPGRPAAGFDLARVEVTTSDRGCIRGSLQWVGLGAAAVSKGKEKVAFTLLEIKPGYTVVGETVEGPKLLSSLCWRMQSINGSDEARPAWIRRGDVLILEGPKWATKRLIQPLPKRATQKPRVETSMQTPEATKAVSPSHSESLPKATSPKPVSPSHVETPGRPCSETASLAAMSSRSISAAPLPTERLPLAELSMSTPPQIAKPSRAGTTGTRAIPQEASNLSRSIDFEVVQASLVDAPRIVAHSSGGYSREASPPAVKETTTLTTEATGASASDRPVIPVLDLNTVAYRREQKLRDAAAHMPAGLCEVAAGCDFGWVECNMVQPPKPGKYPEGFHRV